MEEWLRRRAAPRRRTSATWRSCPTRPTTSSTRPRTPRSLVSGEDRTGHRPVLPTPADQLAVTAIRAVPSRTCALRRAGRTLRHPWTPDIDEVPGHPHQALAGRNRPPGLLARHTHRSPDQRRATERQPAL